MVQFWGSAMWICFLHWSSWRRELTVTRGSNSRNIELVLYDNKLELTLILVDFGRCIVLLAFIDKSKLMLVIFRSASRGWSISVRIVHFFLKPTASDWLVQLQKNNNKCSASSILLISKLITEEWYTTLSPGLESFSAFHFPGNWGIRTSRR